MRSLEELLPQAPPMVLLTDYEEPVDEAHAVAYVDVKETSFFYDARLGGVPSGVALEYLSQAMALRAGLTRVARGEKPRIGFVLGSRRLETTIPFFQVGERYRIEVDCTFQDDEFGSFACEMTDSQGRVVARGQLTAYQPPDGKVVDPAGLEPTT